MDGADDQPEIIEVVNTSKETVTKSDCAPVKETSSKEKDQSTEYNEVANSANELSEMEVDNTHESETVTEKISSIEKGLSEVIEVPNNVNKTEMSSDSIHESKKISEEKKQPETFEVPNTVNDIEMDTNSTLASEIVTETSTKQNDQCEVIEVSNTANEIEMDTDSTSASETVTETSTKENDQLEVPNSNNETEMDIVCTDESKTMTENLIEQKDQVEATEVSITINKTDLNRGSNPESEMVSETSTEENDPPKVTKVPTTITETETDIVNTPASRTETEKITEDKTEESKISESSIEQSDLIGTHSVSKTKGTTTSIIDSVDVAKVECSMSVDNSEEIIILTDDESANKVNVSSLDSGELQNTLKDITESSKSRAIASIDSHETQLNEISVDKVFDSINLVENVTNTSAKIVDISEDSTSKDITETSTNSNQKLMDISDSIKDNENDSDEIKIVSEISKDSDIVQGEGLEVSTSKLKLLKPTDSTINVDKEDAMDVIEDSLEIITHSSNKAKDEIKTTINDSKVIIEDISIEIADDLNGTQSIVNTSQDSDVVDLTQDSTLNITSESTKDKIQDSVNTVEKDSTVIDITEDSNDTTDSNVKKKKLVCLNRACKSAFNLMDADSFVFTYYDVRLSKRNNKVCKPCHVLAKLHFEELEKKFTQNECLFDHKFPSETFVLLYSDEEIELSSDSDDEEGPKLDDNTVDLINTELNNMIAELLPSGKVNSHVTKVINKTLQDANQCAKELDEWHVVIGEMQKKVDKIHLAFYEPFRREINELPSLILEDKEKVKPPDVNVTQTTSTSTSHAEEFRRQQNQQHQAIMQRNWMLQQSRAANRPSPRSDEILFGPVGQKKNPKPADLPIMAPLGFLHERTPIIVGSSLYVVKQTLLGAWTECTVLDCFTHDPAMKRYKVKLKSEKKVKIVSGKHLAYTKANLYMYRVGMRVIALFGETEYFSGTVAEIPKETNKWRYLIFFDDGYFSYTNHNNIFIICEPSQKPSSDVPLLQRDFITEYLSKYPERAMVKLYVGEKIMTLYKNKWVNATVIEVDCSLALLQFGTEQEVDWIFRGSYRLRPLFESRENATRRIKEMAARNLKLANYNNTHTSGPSKSKVTVQTARKSLSAKKNPNIYFEVSSSDKKLVWTPVKVPGKAIYKKVDGIPIYQSRKFEVHMCSRSCISWVKWNFEQVIKRVNLLAVPLYTGFTRTLITYNNGGQRQITYTAPCGRRLRDLEEVGRFLGATRAKWTIDMFDYDIFVDCLRDFTIENANITIKDISHGREYVPIPCVNYIDTDVPLHVDYMTARKPKDGVNINISSDFLVCCDCTDNCLNKATCACWQLTLQGNADLLKSKIDEKHVGYRDRRLPEHVVSGIYECNKNCKCSRTCYNRVVQFPLIQKLQLFKTEMKGWGLRCINDIPQGTFICIYAGHLLTDNDANEEGKNYGDEYLAELDFIEVLERAKEGYESDVPDDDDDDDNDDDEDSDTSSSNIDENSIDKDIRSILSDEEDDIRSRLRKRKKKEDKKAKSNATTTKPKKKEKIDKKPLREFYGEDESVYIMDARTSGNIGRYLNHSCSPNVFVQNVFVDTHDPRFPWVSFFALKFIEAGTELTWDYAYDIGSVPGKVVYCYCGSQDCRHRLL